MKGPFGLFRGTNEPWLLRPAMARAVGLGVLWLVLAGGNPVDLAPGAVAALAATWVSLHFLPSGAISVRPASLAGFTFHFLRQSVVAGVDVARRALDPRLPLHPGFVVYQPDLPPGPSQHMFTILMSLLPGTVPTGPAPGSGLLIHCLDVEQPITAQLATEEALFSSVIGWKQDNG
jgi:multicomponent Na+:H+ antiporter subunit E